MTTSFIPQHHADLFPAAKAAAGEAVCQAALSLVLQERRRTQEFTQNSGGEGSSAQSDRRVAVFGSSNVHKCRLSADPFSPFGSSSGWRNNIQFNRNMTLQLGDKSKQDSLFLIKICLYLCSEREPGNVGNVLSSSVIYRSAKGFIGLINEIRRIYIC